VGYLKNQYRKEERLCSAKMIDLLFKEGKSVKTGCLRIVYLATQQELPYPIQILISVPKKSFKNSVDRNLLKRRIREAYRLNKHPLVKALVRENINIITGIIYLGNEINDYQVIEKSIVQSIIKLLDVIELDDRS
jgi:ribonuclease P protein component